MEKQMMLLFSDTTKDMFRCPLFVFWLGFMLEKTNKYDIRTKTTFFKSLVNVILHKTLVRERRLKDEDHLDIFHEDSISSSLRNELTEFGKLAVQRLVTGDLLFTEKDLQLFINIKLSMLLKSDILMKYKSITDYEEEMYYQPMHRTFLEFLAAFSVCTYSLNGKRKALKNLKRSLTKLMQQSIVPSENSLFYPFLAGLLELDADLLFESLYPWKSVFHINTKPMKCILV